MNHQVSLLHFKLLTVCALLFCSCADSADSGAQLEVINMRYESAEISHCTGELKNISRAPLSNLKVEVEFQTANGERVRGNIVDLPQGELQPNMGSNFSVPYLKGSNDPQVARCRVLSFKTNGDRTILHTNLSVK